jgi:hypothetical protein
MVFNDTLMQNYIKIIQLIYLPNGIYSNINHNFDSLHKFIYKNINIVNINVAIISACKSV